MLALLLGSIVYSVRLLRFTEVKSTLLAWQRRYVLDSAEFRSVPEMVAWERLTPHPHVTVGLCTEGELMAMVQMVGARSEGRPVFCVRAIATSPVDPSAGYELLKRVLSVNTTTVHWEDIQKNPRWYIAAKYLS